MEPKCENLFNKIGWMEPKCENLFNKMEWMEPKCEKRQTKFLNFIFLE